MVSAESLYITAGMHVAMILLYSGYSKALKTLDMRLVSEIIFVTKSLDHTLVQINKVIALVALNLIALAFCPYTKVWQDDLLLISLVMILVHSSYSTYYYYGSSNIPLISRWPRICSEIVHEDPKKRGLAIKKISLVAGWISEMALILGVFAFIGLYEAGLVTVIFGVIHFYMMEIDHEIVL